MYINIIPTIHSGANMLVSGRVFTSFTATPVLAGADCSQLPVSNTAPEADYVSNEKPWWPQFPRKKHIGGRERQKIDDHDLNVAQGKVILFLLHLDSP